MAKRKQMPKPWFNDRQGFWEVKLTVEVDGVKKRVTLRDRDKDALQLKIADMHLKDDFDFLSTRKKMTFGEWMDLWITQVKVGLGAKTRSMYEGRIKCSLKPDLGHIPLDKLNTKILRDYINSLYLDGARKDGKPGGLSPRTVKDFRNLLDAILKDAVKEKLIKENPMNTIEVRKVPKKKPPILKPEEVQALINASRKHRLSACLILAISTGIRKGEMLGLKWENVNLKEKYITICETITKAWGSQNIKGEPKTEGSYRTIPIPQAVVEELKRHKLQTEAEKFKANKWLDTGYVFCNTQGNYTAPNTFDKIWTRWRNDAGIPHIDFHDLRHNFISVLINQGHDLRTVMSVSGHTQIKTLMQTYAHLIDPMSRKVAEGMEGFLDEVI